jgi:hypothetical protein
MIYSMVNNNFNNVAFLILEMIIMFVRIITQFTSPPDLAGREFKGSTDTARACFSVQTQGYLAFW